MNELAKRIIYEDNHLMAVNKLSGELVQGDRTGDEPLIDKLKHFIKIRDNKPGNVFLGLIHRVDRPVSGIVLFAKTSKGLSRMNKLFHDDAVEKIYWAVVGDMPNEESQTLKHYLIRNQKQNKSYAHNSNKPGSKEARLSYTLLGNTGRYFLLQVQLHTGRHHQIRAQLAKVGLTIRGDLKYGAPRSNPDGGINLHAYSLSFKHPISEESIHITAKPPSDTLWDACWEIGKKQLNA